MTDARSLCAVAIGAAIGGVARYLIGQAFLQKFGPGFPFGTLFINVAGSFLIGIVVEYSLTRTPDAGSMLRIFAASGILGGFTTFSTFSLETVALLETNVLRALTYAGTSVFGSVAAAALGLFCARAALR